MESTTAETPRRRLDSELRRLHIHELLTLAQTHPTFVSLLATIILMEIAHGIELLALFPLYLSDVEHESVSLVALTISVYLIVDILTRTPAGWLADRAGRKPVLMAGILLSALPLPFMMQTRDTTLFLLLNVVNGLGAGCIWPSIYASVADRYGPGRRGLIFGLVNTVMLGGLASGPISGGLLIGRSGSFAFSFLFCLAIVILALAIVALGVRDTTGTAGEFVGAVVLATRRARDLKPSAGGLRIDRQMITLFMIVFCLTLGVALLVPILTFYGRDVLGLRPDQFALTLALPGLVTAAALVPFGRWVDRHGRKRPLIAGMAVFALCLWLSPLSTAPLVVAFGAAIGGLGYALAVPAWNALTMDMIPRESRGTMLGVVASLQGIGLVVGPYAGGALWEQVSHLSPFLASAAVLSLGAALSLTIQDE
jgi:MFS transporter, DHA1 family, multidrug resistance protein